MNTSHRKKIKTFSRPFVPALIAAACIAFIGIYLLVSGRAATSVLSAEPENGTATAPAVAVSDTTASGSKYIKFGSSPTPPTPTPPTPTPPTPPANPSGGCAVNGVAAPCMGSATTGATGWGSPVFFDEFNGTSLDTNKWAPCWYPDSYTGDRCGMMNESTTDKKNVVVKDGAAILTQAARDSGALINTDPKAGAKTGFMMGAGYAEARVYFPGSGSTSYNFPAWWINGPLSGYGDGEIDVAEGLDTMTTNYHYDNGGGHVANNSNTIPGTWSNSWHTYAVHRKSGENIVYFDGKEVRRYTTYDKLAPESLIFNVGTKESRTMVYGTASQVKIDYVRIWKQ